MRVRFATGLVAGVLLLSGCTNAWSRGQIDLVARFTTETDTGWPYLDARDQTVAVCGPVTDCVQAVGSDYLTLLKFRSVEDAARYATFLGADAVQIDPLVVHFNGKPLTAQLREDVIDVVSGINADSPD